MFYIQKIEMESIKFCNLFRTCPVVLTIIAVIMRLSFLPSFLLMSSGKECNILELTLGPPF